MTLQEFKDKWRDVVVYGCCEQNSEAAVREFNADLDALIAVQAAEIWQLKTDLARARFRIGTEEEQDA